MKTFLKIIATIGFIGINIIAGFAYNLTEKDYNTIDAIEERAFEIIDTHEKISPEMIVDILEQYQQKKVDNERMSEILLTVIDDIEYSYYLGEYSEAGSITMTQEDCYEGEKFDSVEGYCYSEEGVDNTTNYGDVYDNNTPVEGHQEEETENIRATYSISGNTLIRMTGEEKEEDKKIFEIFTTLIPESARKDFKLFKVYNSPDGDTAAHVAQDNSEPNKWNITVNVDSFYVDGKLDLKESLHTLIHEYSHVLTLGKTQVKYLEQTASDEEYERARNICRGYFLQEGCLHNKAFLNSFIKKFWKQDFKKSQEGENNDFYSGKEDNFVSDYASTNPGEDIAESFTHFVLNSQPTGTTIADQKILFFYNYPKIVKLRTIIRNRLSQVQ